MSNWAMNRIRNSIRLVCVAFFLFPIFAHAEFINSFVSDIVVRKDATITVTETIEYVFTEERHGILREIPLLHGEESSDPLKERIIEIDLTGVTMDGEEVPYELESTDDMFVVRIGDPGATIKGKHTYALSYAVSGGLSYPVGEGTELYWNVTGNEWQVPINFVEARIRDIDGVFRTNRSCYSGELGEGNSCLTEVAPDGLVTFRTKELFPYEGMTIAQALNPTAVVRDVRERIKTELIAIPLLVLGFLYGVYRLYRYKTAHKIDAPIIPEYEPYPDMKPMYSGFLMDGRLDPRDITACIVYLAEQGYLKIRKTEKKVLFLFEVDEYAIELLKLPDENISSFESRIFGLIFKDPLTVGTTVSLSELKRDRVEGRENFKEFTALQSDLRYDLVRLGFHERMSWLSIGQTVGIVCAVWAALYVLLVGEVNGGLFVVGIGIAIVLGVFLYERRTSDAYERINYLKGFKLFLATTERDRYLFHNAPEKNPEQFMEYLPYAIAFGVEKEWAKVFEGITIPNPGWYDGGSATSFNAANLSTSLGAFSTAFAASSGASASSGGGSSGGGTGGGGGGSW
jgi:hypothetical protein